MSQSLSEIFPLFESIKALHGKLYNTYWHETRMRYASRMLWGKEMADIDWDSIEQLIPTDGLFKLKLFYNETDFTTEIQVYQKRPINQLIIVEDDEIRYHLKFSQRNVWLAYTNNLLPNQDIIVEQNGYLTDSSYANIALWNGNEWHTPKTPILHGTQRSFLLANNELVEKNIRMKDLGNYKKISLINAMLDLGELEIGVEKVVLS